MLNSATTAHDFKTIYANSFGFSLGDNDFKLTFGVSDVSNHDEVTELVSVYLTHKSFRLLAYSLDSLVTHYEKMTGALLPLDAAKIEALNGALSTIAANASPQQPLQSPPVVPAS